MSAVKILVVDDEPELLDLVVEWLEEEGCEVYSATDATEGLQLFFQHKPALAITDLVMPGMDGFQFISRIREMSDAHVLVLTALDSDENMIRGLELGADEYLVKPVSRRTFVARVRSILRRAISHEEVLAVYSDDALTLDYLNHEIQIRGEMVYLRPTEFRLLATLIQNSDRLLGHQELLDRVWGTQSGSLDSLKWHVSVLRDKVEEDPKNPRLIVTAPRVGYRYVRPEPAPLSHSL